MKKKQQQPHRNGSKRTKGRMIEENCSYRMKREKKLLLALDNSSNKCGMLFSIRPRHDTHIFVHRQMYGANFFSSATQKKKKTFFSILLIRFGKNTILELNRSLLHLQRHHTSQPASRRICKSHQHGVTQIQLWILIKRNSI